MKVKKIFMVSLILLTILCLGAVSAADNATADELAVEDAGAVEVPAGEEISADGDASDVSVGDTNNRILGTSQVDEKLSDAKVIVVNQDNYMSYFNQTNHGKLVDSIEPNTTLDIQGAIVNSNSSENIFMEINKPVNIISTTGDGYIVLNSTRMSTSSTFGVTHEGSGSNITGISFHNTRIQITNASHIVLDKLSIVNNQPMGAGATTFCANSTYITLKNSYMFATINGQSSPFTFAWADYCTLDNNTFVGGTNVPNLIYLFVPINQYGLKPTDTWVNSHNNFTNNKIYGEGARATFNVMSGIGNLFENNTLINTLFTCQRTDGGIYIGNIATDGVVAGTNSLLFNNYLGGLTTGANSIAYNNILKAMTVSKEAVVYNNTVGDLTLSGADAIVHDNIVNGATTISAKNIQIYDNTFIGDYTIKFNNANANNITFSGNDVIGNILFANKNAKNNKIVNNTITTSDYYAIDLQTFTGTENNISNNILNSKKGFGNDAVNHAEDSTLILDNYQNENATITVEVRDIKVGETAFINVTANETSIKSVDVIVNGKKYVLNLTDGKGSLELSDLLSEKYDVLVTSNDLTYGGQNNASFEVSKNVFPEMVVDAPDKTQWIDSNITVTIKDATGNVTLEINGSEFTVELEDGVAIFAVPDFAYGTYDFNISYSGDYKYFGNTTNGTLTVNKNKEVKIIAFDMVVDIIADKFTAKFTNYIDEGIANANVTITVGDAIYPLVTDENGTATAVLALNRGQYDVNVEFKAIEDEFDEATAKYTITVIDGSIMKIVSVDGDGIIIGSLTDAIGTPLANATVIATMNGVETNLTTDDAGLFKFQAQNGYKVEFKFEGDNTTTLSDMSITLNNVAHILKDSVIVVSSVSRAAVDTGAGEKGKAYTFILKDAENNTLVNKTVKVTLNGNVYTVKTDANGKGSVVISLNAAKKYNLNVFFMGDDDYKGSTAVAKITVTKKKTTLKAAKTKYTFKAKAKSKVIKATLKTSNKYLKKGKKVTIKIKGKTYTAKTGKNGVIKLNIKALSKKGTYKAKIKFAGDSTYKASSSKTIKIVIK